MSERTVEPTNVGPIAGGGLRASDADREQVSTVLSTAYSEGRITREEHDERLDQVLQARTFDDLMPITADLVPVPQPATPATEPNPYAIDTAHATGETDTMAAVFGGVTRKGKWRIRRRTNAYAVFGGIDLDLREATFESPEVEISGFWCFGGMEIKAPEGIEIRDQTVGIFGGTDISNVGEPAPGAPVVVIKGMTLFGGVAVKGPKPSRAERRRRHRCH